MSIALFFFFKESYGVDLPLAVHTSGGNLPGDVVLGVLAVVGQSPKQVTGTANQGEAVSEAGAGGRPILGRFSLQTFPFPAARLQRDGHQEVRQR